jgi:hypothetical protein
MMRSIMTLDTEYGYAECCCVIMLSFVEYHDPDKLGRCRSSSYWVLKTVLK